MQTQPAQPKKSVFFATGTLPATAACPPFGGDRPVYRGGFLSVKELSAKYRMSVKLFRLYIHDAGIDLKGRHLLSPKQVNLLIAEYGQF